MDLFHRTSVYREYFPKIVRGAILEISTRPGPRLTVQDAEAKFRALDFLDAITVHMTASRLAKKGGKG